MTRATMRLGKALAVVACVIAPLACADSPDPDLVAASHATLARVVGDDTLILTEIAEPIVDHEVEARRSGARDGPSVDEDSDVSMMVIGPGRIGGSTGCNEYTADVLLQVTRLSVSDLVSGTEPCSSDEAERREAFFLAALRQGGELFLDTTRFPAVLVIDPGGDTVLVFDVASP